MDGACIPSFSNGSIKKRQSLMMQASPGDSEILFISVSSVSSVANFIAGKNVFKKINLERYRCILFKSTPVYSSERKQNTINEKGGINYG
jgi:hypothetical protein